MTWHFSSEEKNCIERRSRALDPNACSVELAELAKDTDAWVRTYVAGHPHTLPEILDSLAGDSFYNVQAVVAGNPRTPAKTLEAMLACANAHALTRYIVNNPNCPTHLRVSLFLELGSL